MKTNISLSRKSVATAVMMTCFAFSQQVMAQDGKVQASGLGLSSANGETTINLTGRLHFDVRSFNSAFANNMATDKDTAKYGDTYDIRRARIGFNGTFMKDLAYEVVFNAASSDSTNLDTGFVNYTLSKPLQIRVGKFKQQFNLEELTSSNNIDFIERSYANQFAPGKKLGMMVHGVPKDGLYYGASMFQEGTAVSSASRNTQSAVRLAGNLAQLTDMKDSVLHFGAAKTSGSFDVAAGATGDVLKLRTDARGVDGVFASTFANGSTANINEVSRSQTGLELAYAYGPFKVQTETIKSQYNFNNGATGATLNTVDGKINAQYLAVVYNITGEKWSNAYKDGAFSGTRPLANFSSSGKGMGAWQVGMRVSSYDASDWAATTATTGSKKGNTTTLGVNWILNPNARIMLNHSTSKFDTAFAASAATGDKETVTTLRTQINF
jgi:phosphate-selective porin OprO/OprP